MQMQTRTKLPVTHCQAGATWSSTGEDQSWIGCGGVDTCQRSASKPTSTWIEGDWKGKGGKTEENGRCSKEDGVDTVRPMLQSVMRSHELSGP